MGIKVNPDDLTNEAYLRGLEAGQQLNKENTIAVFQSMIHKDCERDNYNWNPCPRCAWVYRALQVVIDGQFKEDFQKWNDMVADLNRLAKSQNTSL